MLGFVAGCDIAPAMSAPEPEIVVDARGHHCPVPTLRLRRALADAPPGAIVRLYADDPMARIDVPHLAAGLGVEITERSEIEGVLSFVIRKPA
jgi:tRNA 2-thiouridine synthesizing protein A